MSLSAITCYFNPIGYRRRLVNYRTFRSRLTVPLVTVELSTTGVFDLSPGEADVLIQLRSPAVLWHKERLLNIGLAAVPRECDKVAWLDCDVVFERSDWAERTSEALERVAVVQPYQDFQELSPAAAADEVDRAHCTRIGRSLSYGFAVGAVGTEIQGEVQRLKGWNAGLAWAGRRELFEIGGFYDACIIGGGDRAIMCAGLGQFEYPIRHNQMNERQAEHYLAWARPHHARVRGSTGFVEGTLFHLWHGDLQDRRYTERYRGLKEFDFDPFADIAIDDNGCWRWSSDKAAMHRYVRDYFATRREDG